MAERSQSNNGMSTGERARMIVGAIIVILIVWFAIANRHRVRVDFLLFDRNSRMIYVIIGSALLGAIADRLFFKKKK